MAMSYCRISGDHLADHLIYLFLLLLLPRPLPSLPSHRSCATHRRCHPCVAILPSIAVDAVLSIAIAATVAIVPSIAIIAVALPSAIAAATAVAVRRWQRQDGSRVMAAGRVAVIALQWQ
jgi:hypothetical protein